MIEHGDEQEHDEPAARIEEDRAELLGHVVEVRDGLELRDVLEDVPDDDEGEDLVLLADRLRGRLGDRQDQEQHLVEEDERERCVQRREVVRADQRGERGCPAQRSGQEHQPEVHGEAEQRQPHRGLAELGAPGGMEQAVVGRLAAVEDRGHAAREEVGGRLGGLLRARRWVGGLRGALVHGPTFSEIVIARTARSHTRRPR
ncbi:MAG: hypothetical protein ACFCGT_11105 [Sandaracinaceae bacterium]